MGFLEKAVEEGHIAYLFLKVLSALLLLLLCVLSGFEEEIDRGCGY